MLAGAGLLAAGGVLAVRWRWRHLEQRRQQEQQEQQSAAAQLLGIKVRVYWALKLASSAS